jgi:hypothetical protein
MGTASFGGWVFRIDPTSVKWDFKVRTNTTYTIGGKVVQILGTELGNIDLMGTFGRGGYQEQRRFLNAMIDVGDDQVRNFTEDEPPRFIYPAYGWDFLCYLVSYTGAEGQAVTYAPEIINPMWRLSLHIVEDNSGLTEATTNDFIARLARGIGWEINQYNGPGGWEGVRQFLTNVGAQDMPHVLQMAYGAGEAGAPAGFQPGSQVSVQGEMSPSEIAYVAQQAGFRGEKLVLAVAISLGESSGNPNANGDTTITDGTWGPSVGLWQIRSINAQRGTGGERDQERLTDPYFNARSAWSISSQGTDFGPWTVYTRGLYHQHMSAARQGAANPTQPQTTSSGAQGGQSTAGAAFP